MQITSHCAQILTEDGESSAGINVNRSLSGYGATLEAWGTDSIYLAKHKEYNFFCLIVAPSPKWKGDLENDGYEIIMSFKELTDNHLELQKIIQKKD
jgi:hypothetical protein